MGRFLAGLRAGGSAVRSQTFAVIVGFAAGLLVAALVLPTHQSVKVLGTKNNNKTPTWMRAEGGVGTAPPGQSLSATVNLPKGTYAVIDTASLGNGGP